MLWLSYECFSTLRKAFLLKSAISSHAVVNSAGKYKKTKTRNFVKNVMFMSAKSVSSDITSIVNR